jgi:hypothetical protein
MQLEVFCVEETVRGYQQRIAAHAERERIALLLTPPRCAGHTRRAARQALPISLIGAVARGISFLRCTAMPRRWSSCTALT